VRAFHGAGVKHADFVNGFYVAPCAQAVVDVQGRLAHNGHEPGHVAESVRKSSHKPELSPEQLKEMYQRHVSDRVDLNSLQSELLRSNVVLDRSELRHLIHGNAEEANESHLPVVNDPAVAALDSEDAVDEKGLVVASHRSKDVVFLARYSVHTDANAASTANLDPDSELEIVSEISFPSRLTGGERRTFDCTDAAANLASLEDEDGDPTWSVFDAFLKKDNGPSDFEEALPAAFGDRRVGRHGEHAGKSLRLQALVYIRLDEAKRTARCMEAQEVDGTTNVDRSGRCAFRVCFPAQSMLNE